MRVLAALAAGAVLAGAASIAVVNVVSSSSEAPSDKPLYNYGTR